MESMEKNTGAATIAAALIVGIALVVSGLSYKIKEVEEILQLIDIPALDEAAPRRVAVQHRDPAEVAKHLKTLLGGKSEKGQAPFKAVATPSAVIIL